jgi:hypothetical protein
VSATAITRNGNRDQRCDPGPRQSQPNGERQPVGDAQVHDDLTPGTIRSRWCGLFGRLSLLHRCSSDSCCCFTESGARTFSAVAAGLAAGHNSRQYPSSLSAASAVDHRYRTVRAAAGIGAADQEHTQRSRRATTEYQVRDRPNRLNDATQSPQRLRPTHLRTRTPGQVRQGHGGQYHLNRRANEDGRSLTFAEVAPPLFGSHGLSRYSERLNASDWTGRLPLLLCCAGQMQRWPWPSRMSQFRFRTWPNWAQPSRLTTTHRPVAIWTSAKPRWLRGAETEGLAGRLSIWAIPSVMAPELPNAFVAGTSVTYGGQCVSLCGCLDACVGRP